jgi:hypothetical protein
MKIEPWVIIISIFLLLFISATIISGSEVNAEGNKVSTSCIESWKCSAWSNCSTHGLQIRACHDLNNCSTTTEKPSIVQVQKCKKKTNDTNTNIQSQKKALFDIVLEIVTEPKKSGEDLITKVSLINFGASKSINANLKYIISDNTGAILKQYQKTMLVTTQTEFLDHINTTGIPNGKYTIKIKLTYAGQIDPASTEKTFNIGKVGTAEKIFRDLGVRTGVLSIVTMTLLIGVYLKSQKKELRK